MKTTRVFHREGRAWSRPATVRCAIEVASSSASPATALLHQYSGWDMINTSLLTNIPPPERELPAQSHSFILLTVCSVTPYIGCLSPAKTKHEPTGLQRGGCGVSFVRPRPEASTGRSRGSSRIQKWCVCRTVRSVRSLAINTNSCKYITNNLVLVRNRCCYD